MTRLGWEEGLLQYQILGKGVQGLRKSKILKILSKNMGASCCRNRGKLWSCGPDQACGPLAAWANVQIENK